MRLYLKGTKEGCNQKQDRKWISLTVFQAVVFTAPSITQGWLDVQNKYITQVMYNRIYIDQIYM